MRSVFIREATYFWVLCGWRSKTELATNDKIAALKPDVILSIRRGPVPDDLRVLLETLPLHEVKVLHFSYFPLRQNDALPANFDCARALCSMPQLRALTMDFYVPPLACDILETTSAEEVTISGMSFRKARSRRLLQYSRSLAKQTGGEVYLSLRCVD